MKSKTRCENRDFLSLHQKDMHNNALRCCAPFKCFSQAFINPPDYNEAVKIICSNEECQEGTFMHKKCFDHWIENIVLYFDATNNTKNYSDAQKMQYIWTKKGYELVYKFCECRCSKGFLKRDTNGLYPNHSTLYMFDNTIRNKHKNETYNKNYYENQNNNFMSNKYRVRTISKSSKSSNSSLSINASPPSPHSFCPQYPRILADIHNNPLSDNSFSGKSNSETYYINEDNPLTVLTQDLPITDLSTQPSDLKVWKKQTDSTGNVSNFDMSPMTSKHTLIDDSMLGCIFPVRMDYTIFNYLPRSLINSFHIKMDDEGPHGNDEIRYALLSHLSLLKTTSLSCIFCHIILPIYDRYPLLDGTLFLSPVNYFDIFYKNYSSSTFDQDIITNKPIEPIRFKLDHHSGSRMKEDKFNKGSPYLNAICMYCATGTKIFDLLRERFLKIDIDQLYKKMVKKTDDDNINNNSIITSKLNIVICKLCNKPWDGSKFTIGTLYFYDILSANNCCQPRKICNSCGTQILNFEREMNEDNSTLFNMYTPNKYPNNAINGNFNNGCYEPYNSFNSYGKVLNNPMCKLPYTPINGATNFPMEVQAQHLSHNYYSHYSQTYTCPNCNKIDYHFVKINSYELIRMSIPDSICNG